MPWIPLPYTTPPASITHLVMSSPLPAPSLNHPDPPEMVVSIAAWLIPTLWQDLPLKIAPETINTSVFSVNIKKNKNNIHYKQVFDSRILQLNYSNRLSSEYTSSYNTKK